MRDGPIRRLVKMCVLGLWQAELSVRRAGRRLRGRPRWELAGACEGCAACCEMPGIQVGRVAWFFPTARRAFLWWQRVVNGFALIEADRQTRSFSFRCTHFDEKTRRCDSYGSRPAMCRDYPRVQLQQPWPRMFDGCGFRAKATGAAGLIAEIDATDLDDAAKAALRRRMYLD